MFTPWKFDNVAALLTLVSIVYAVLVNLDARCVQLLPELILLWANGRCDQVESRKVCWHSFCAESGRRCCWIGIRYFQSEGGDSSSIYPPCATHHCKHRLIQPMFLQVGKLNGLEGKAKTKAELVQQLCTCRLGSPYLRTQLVRLNTVTIRWCIYEYLCGYDD
jgi:hypothetical protein